DKKEEAYAAQPHRAHEKEERESGKISRAQEGEGQPDWPGKVVRSATLHEHSDHADDEGRSVDEPRFHCSPVLDPRLPMRGPSRRDSSSPGQRHLTGMIPAGEAAGRTAWA